MAASALQPACWLRADRPGAAGLLAASRALHQVMDRSCNASQRGQKARDSQPHAVKPSHHHSRTSQAWAAGARLADDSGADPERRNGMRPRVRGAVEVAQQRPQHAQRGTLARKIGATLAPGTRNPSNKMEDPRDLNGRGRRNAPSRRCGRVGPAEVAPTTFRCSVLSSQTLLSTHTIARALSVLLSVLQSRWDLAFTSGPAPKHPITLKSLPLLLPLPLPPAAAAAHPPAAAAPSAPPHAAAPCPAHHCAPPAGPAPAGCTPAGLEAAARPLQAVP